MRRLLGNPPLFLLPIVLAAGCVEPPPLPTATVVRRDFSHRLTAYGQLRAKTAVSVTVPQDVRSMVRIVWLAPEGSEVREGDVVARFDRSDMEQRLEEGEANLATSALRIQNAEVDGATEVSHVDKSGRLAALELEVAQRYQKRDSEIWSRAEIAESQIDEELAQRRQGHAETVRPVRESLSQVSVELLDVDRQRAEHDVSQARSGLAALEVRSPHSGILTWTRDWEGDLPQIGDQVWRGQELGQIPDLDDMEAEVFVLEADAAGLAVGCRATVEIEAYPGVTFDATVSHVDAVAKRQYRGSPVQYFGVVLRLDRTDKELMKPGQRVRAALLLAEEHDALVVPRQALFLEDGKSHVRVVDGSETVLRAVEVGAQSLGLSVIVAGLEEGEVVALEPPSGAIKTGREEQEREGPGPAIAVPGSVG